MVLFRFLHIILIVHFAINFAVYYIGVYNNENIYEEVYFD